MISAQETESYIGNGFCPRDLGNEYGNKIFGVSLEQGIEALYEQT